MKDSQLFEFILGWLIRTADRHATSEVTESDVISCLQEEVGLDRVGAIAKWEALSSTFRNKKVVRDGFLVEWRLFRGALQVIKLPTVEEVQSTAEIYDNTTNEELERKIRNLSGMEFERFLAAVLGRQPEYRNISLTPASHDGGIDIRGLYVPANEQLQAPLFGQAKQVSAPIPASTARDFIGSLDIAGERRVYGLLVSSGGFTEPAVKAIRDSRYHITRWDMSDLLRECRDIATRQVHLSFSVPDQTFWDEVVG